MNVILNINLNVGTGGSGVSPEQLEYIFEQISNLEKKYSKPVVTTKVVQEEIGPYEQYYLTLTGRSRMNHNYQTMTREQQALFYLKRMKAVISENTKEEILPPVLDETENSENETEFHGDPLS